MHNKLHIPTHPIPSIGGIKVSIGCFQRNLYQELKGCVDYIIERTSFDVRFHRPILLGHSNGSKLSLHIPTRPIPSIGGINVSIGCWQRNLYQELKGCVDYIIERTSFDVRFHRPILFGHSNGSKLSLHIPTHPIPSIGCTKVSIGCFQWVV